MNLCTYLYQRLLVGDNIHVHSVGNHESRAKHYVFRHHSIPSIYHILCRHVKSHHAAVLMNLCIALIIANVIFVVGAHRVDDQVSTRLLFHRSDNGAVGGFPRSP